MAPSGDERIRPTVIALVGLMLLLPVAFLGLQALRRSSGGWPSPDLPAEPRTAAAPASPSFEDLINLSLTHLNARHPERSLEPLERARALKPGSSVVYNNLGVAYIMLGRHDEAIAACRKALELNPSFQLARNNLNWALSEKEKARGRQ